MATSTRWTMRQEPYDPDARDADNDGIVQEQTPWERPAGTRLVDELGRAITRGANATNRPRGLRVVDRDGNTVDYTPTYDRPGGGFGAGGGTPLGEAGALSLRERGLRSVRDITAESVADSISKRWEEVSARIESARIDGDVADATNQPLRLGGGAIAGAPSSPDLPEEPNIPEAKKRIRDRIRQKNKEILDKISKSGGSWARVDKEFLEKDAQNAENHHVATPLTPEEAAKFRREFMKQNVLAFQHFLKTGKAPTEDDGFPKWISDQYGYLPAWEDNVSQMPQELRDHIINTDADELIAEAERYALEYHDGLGPPSVRVPNDRLDGILEDGRYKTTHEEFSKHSGASPRREFERQVGIPDDAPDEVRPASGYVVHQDVIDAALKDYLERNGVEATEFSVLNPKEGAVGIYGDIEMVLDPEVAGRTAYGRGDTLNQMARPARLDSEDPDEIANAVLGTGGMNRSWQLDVMLSFLHAGRSGSYADATDRYSWRGEGKEAGPEYTEALIAGSFDLADVAEVRLHPGSRDVTGIENSLTPVLGHDNGRELVDATRDEFFSPEALSKLDLTDEERAYIEQQGLLNVDANNFGRWPGGTRIEQLFQHRKAKEVEDKLRAAGVQKVTHLHESGLNMMDPESFGEESALGTVEEIRAERVRKAIVDDLRRAIERSKKGNTTRSFDVG